MDNLPPFSPARRPRLRVDFTDVYAKTFVAPHPIPVESAVKQFFFSVPGFAMRLLQFREFIGKRLGLKTANGKATTLLEIDRFSGQIGDRVALFEVWDRQATTIVTGQRDKHLDFVLVFDLTNTASEYTLQLTTVVQINSILGRIYLWVVKPIHLILMPILLKRLCHRLINSQFVGA